MKRALPVVLLLAGCASRRDLPSDPATVTLFGERGRLETWEARALAGGHLHARGGDGSCLAVVELFRVMSETVATIPQERREEVRQTAERFAAVLEGMCVALFGRGYGGKDLHALSLRPSAESPEALFVVVPALAPGETERTFRPPHVLAEYLSPLDRVEASIDGGRVHVRRLAGGRHEFEIFLVLRPAAPGAAYERLQVVARVEAGSPR